MLFNWRQDRAPAFLDSQAFLQNSPSPRFGVQSKWAAA